MLLPNLRLILIAFSVLFFMSTVYSQQLPLQVFATAGDEVVQGNYECDWTLGETFTLSYSQPNVLSTSGFHQPELRVVSAVELSFPTIRIFPNPSTQSVWIEGIEKGNYVLYSQEGKQLISGCIQSKGELRLDGLPVATYHLKVLQGGLTQSFTIIKN